MVAHHRHEPPTPQRHHADQEQSDGGDAAWKGEVELQEQEGQDDDEAIEKLRVALSGLLQNSSMLAAFMCSLASAVYAQPPTDPACYNSVKIAACIQWCAMAPSFCASVRVSFLRAT